MFVETTDLGNTGGFDAAAGFTALLGAAGAFPTTAFFVTNFAPTGSASCPDADLFSFTTEVKVLSFLTDPAFAGAVVAFALAAGAALGFSAGSVMRLVVTCEKVPSCTLKPTCAAIGSARVVHRVTNETQAILRTADTTTLI